MPILIEARFWWQRAQGLWRRGVTSLRTRGLAASAQRLALHLHHPTPSVRALYAPQSTPFAPFHMASAAQPQVSLIIPVYGAWAHTLACLRALAEHPPLIPFEVIVVDDASPDDSLQLLRQIKA